MEQVINTNELKDFIQGKFGRISRFARLIGRDPVVVHNQLKGQIHAKELFKLAKDTTDKPLKDLEVTEELSEKIRVTIYTQHKNITDFSNQHPEFSNTWISNVINGKSGGYETERKMITPKIKNLCKTLKIKIN